MLRLSRLVLLGVIFTQFKLDFIQSIAPEAVRFRPKPVPQSKREAALVKIIEQRSTDFSTDLFRSDPILLQLHSVTQYVYPNSKLSPNKLVFEKRNADNGKDSIVLASAESGFGIPTPRGGKKRQFVLLKRAAFAGAQLDQVPYHSSFVYVRYSLVKYFSV